jgi:hypothetical protein
MCLLEINKQTTSNGGKKRAHQPNDYDLVVALGKQLSPYFG